MRKRGSREKKRGKKIEKKKEQTRGGDREKERRIRYYRYKMKYEIESKF